MSRERADHHHRARRPSRASRTRWILYHGILYEAVGPVGEALEESDITTREVLAAGGTYVGAGKKIPAIKPAYGDPGPVLPVFDNVHQGISVNFGMELDLDQLVELGLADDPTRKGKRKPTPVAVAADTFLLGNRGQIKPGDEVPPLYKTPDGMIHVTDVEGLIEKGLAKRMEGSDGRS